jgi:DNA-directed RNA polymerase subunit RPC12/RpoP
MRSIQGFLWEQVRKMGKAHCPTCGEQIALPEELTAGFDTEVSCGHCGGRLPLKELAGRSGERGGLGQAAQVARPEGTAVREIGLEDGTRAWVVPATGKSGGLVFFGAVCTAFSLFFVVAMLGGEGLGGGFEVLFGFLILVVFLAVGVGLIVAGRRVAGTEVRVAVGDFGLRMEKRQGGRRKIKALGRIDRVEMVVLYTANKRPVHGIEIEGEGKRVRFGAGLGVEEKEWLAGELREAAGL